LLWAEVEYQVRPTGVKCFANPAPIVFRYLSYQLPTWQLFANSMKVSRAVGPLWIFCFEREEFPFRQSPDLNHY